MSLPSLLSLTLWAKSLRASAYDSYLPGFAALLPPLFKAYDATPASDSVRSRIADQIALLRASVVIGSLLSDGIGDAILIRGETGGGQSLRLAYNILQAAGCRHSENAEDGGRGPGSLLGHRRR